MSNRNWNDVRTEPVTLYFVDDEGPEFSCCGETGSVMAEYDIDEDIIFIYKNAQGDHDELKRSIAHEVTHALQSPLFMDGIFDIYSSVPEMEKDFEKEAYYMENMYEFLNLDSII